ncbi:MAG: hypothetical protein KDC44_21020, partial [Phaeodactylibacter sp.]|nr:hypothetical protein [Phaeodactylibacter sp.]
RDLILIKADTDGNLEDDCILVSDISVDVIDVPDPVSFPFTLNEYPNPQQEFGVSAGPLDGDLMITDVEECVCVPEIGCDSTFVYIYGEAQDNERGQAIVSVPASLGGGFVIGGGRNDAALITWIDPAGNIILSRTVDAIPTGDELITRLMLDSDDNLIAVGRTDAVVGNSSNAFAFKYSLANDNLLWLNELNLAQPSSEMYYAVDELGPGGNYIIGGQVTPGLNNCDAILIELDRSSGVQIDQSDLDWGSCETYSDLVVTNSAIYTTGRLNYDGSGTSRMRPGVTRFDLNGNQIWTKWYLEGVSTQDIARLYPNEMVDDNGLVIFGYGDTDGTSTDNVVLFLFKIDYDGNLLWAQQYEIPTAIRLRSTTMVSVSDGYVLAGYHTWADEDGFILKTDKLGNLLWSRNLSSPSSNDAITCILAQAGQIFMTGRVDGPSGGVMNDFFLVNLNADGVIDSTNACSLFGELTVNQSPYDSPFEAQFNLEDFGALYPWFVEVNTLGTPEIPLIFECQNSCLDSCDILPELEIVSINAACDASLLLASIEICNNGNVDLPSGAPLTFYNGDPTADQKSV